MKQSRKAEIQAASYWQGMQEAMTHRVETTHNAACASRFQALLRDGVVRPYSPLEVFEHSLDSAYL